MERSRENRHKDAIALHEIEGNPFTRDDEAMFAMFERENMSIEQQTEYINSLFKKEVLQSAE